MFNVRKNPSKRARRELVRLRAAVFSDDESDLDTDSAQVVHAMEDVGELDPRHGDDYVGDNVGEDLGDDIVPDVGDVANEIGEDLGAEGEGVNMRNNVGHDVPFDTDDESGGGDAEEGARMMFGNIRHASPKSVDDISVYLSSLQARREIPIAVMEDIIGYIRANSDLFSQVLATNSLPPFRTMRRHALKTVPTPLMDVSCTAHDGSKVDFT